MTRRDCRLRQDVQGVANQMRLDPTTIRMIFFFGLFTFFAAGEALYPRRIRTVSKKKRWGHNLIITAGNAALVTVLMPLAPAGVAVVAANAGWGVLNVLVFPFWITVVSAVISLDFVIYLQHLFLHRVPVLWRLHAIHHTELDLDVSSGLRFHPLEIILSLFIKSAAVIIIGAPVVAVVIFEIILNGTAMFNHSNLDIPENMDRFIRLFIVTPDMHRVHHSVIIREMDSNFGFNFSWWDRILRTYRAQPRMGHRGMPLGLGRFRDFSIMTLQWLLVVPFNAGIERTTIPFGGGRND